MAGKKLPKDLDFASGFFSSQKDEAAVEEKTVEPETMDSTQQELKQRNPGGRPKKQGLKNRQFTITMSPETYEKLRIIANEYTRGNISALIDDSVKVYCKEHSIDFSKIEIDQDILDKYIKQQERKNKK